MICRKKSKINLPVSLCKYLVKNRLRAGPPIRADGKAKLRGQFWRTACLKSVVVPLVEVNDDGELSSEPPEDDLGRGNGGEDTSP